MKFKLNKPQIIGLIAFLIIVSASAVFFYFKIIQPNLFYFLFGIAFLIAGLPFLVFLILESKKEREKEEMFLEFSRDLVENVKAGTPISKSILNTRNKDYGVLSPYINKLANQISLGISIKTAFETFARDAKSKTILRAITIISESEKAGGNIEDILESVAKSVSQNEKLKKERRNAMYNLVVQGYIIFLIFLVIMLVMQFKILPIAMNLSQGIDSSSPSEISGLTGISLGGGKATPEQLARPFIWLLTVQGFFVGLVIGKLSEGKIIAGLKHSFILVILSILIDAGAKVFLG